MKKYLNICVGESEPIASLFEALSQHADVGSESGFSIVLDGKGKVSGVVTDSDIRRHLEIHGRAPESIDDVINRDFAFTLQSEDRAAKVQRLAGLMQRAGWKTTLPYRFVPELDEDGFLREVLDIRFLEAEITSKRDRTIVVGMGYVGLTTLASIARTGLRVVGVDNNLQTIQGLRNGVVHIEEPGLTSVISNPAHHIEFRTNLGLEKSPSGERRNFIICLPTPLLENESGLDSSIVEMFIHDLCSVLRPGDSIIMRSTVPIGFGTKMVHLVQKLTGLSIGLDFHFISAPERTVEGNALEEIRRLPQLVAGATSTCLKAGTDYFGNLSEMVLECSSLEIAETAKLAGNAYRDYDFAFSNFLAEFCRHEGVDVDEVIQKANFGYGRSNIKKPSPGVGGACLTKDSFSFYSNSDFFYSPIIGARKYNRTVPDQIAEFLIGEIADFSKLSVVAVGMAFKGNPSTTDTRNSPSVEIVRILQKTVSSVRITDGVVRGHIPEIGLTIEGTKNIKDTDVVLLLNDHKDNVSIFEELVSNSKKSKITIFDPWRLIDQETIDENRSGHEISVISMSKRLI